MSMQKGTLVGLTNESLLETDIKGICYEFHVNWFSLLKKYCFPHHKTQFLIINKDYTPFYLFPLIEKKASGLLKSNKLLSLSNYYSSNFEPIPLTRTQSTQEELISAIQAFLEHINALKNWDVMELSPINNKSAFYDLIMITLKQEGMSFQSEFLFENKFLIVDNMTYDEYIKSRPSALRNTLKRKGNQLKKLNHQFLLLTDKSKLALDELDKYIQDYEAVYQSSWKPEEGSSDFIKALCLWSFDQGWLRLGITYIDDKPVAAQIWFVCNSTAFIFKLAYDKTYKSLSVGSLLTNHIIKHVIEVDRVKKVDFLNGGESYKSDWMSHEGERCCICIYNRKTMKGRLYSLRARLKTLKNNFIRGIE
jgi:hypothetical protein